MGQHYTYLVPRLSSLDDIDQKEAAIHAYFLSKNIIKPVEISGEDSLSGEACYPFAEGFKDILVTDLSTEIKKMLCQQVSGVAYRRDPRKFYWTGMPHTVTCPACHASIGEDVPIDEVTSKTHISFDWINMWLTGQDQMTCPQCQHTADINDYDFQEPAAFSNFAVVFFNGLSGFFSAEFIQDIADIMGTPIIGLDQRA